MTDKKHSIIPPLKVKPRDPYHLFEVEPVDDYLDAMDVIEYDDVQVDTGTRAYEPGSGKYGVDI